MFVDEIKSAFDVLLEQERHNLRAISRKSGVNNSTVNRLNSKKADFSNIPALTIQRLFPEMRVYFFRSDWPGGVTVTGPNSGAIANGAHAKATVRNGTDPVTDDSTRMLLTYWRDVPQSKRFEFLMKLAEMKEDLERE
jgi:hypothetical protein